MWQIQEHKSSLELELGLDHNSQAERDREDHLRPPWGAESPLQSCRVPLW